MPSGDGMNEIVERIKELEDQLESGNYTPGPWSRLVTNVRQLSDEERRKLSVPMTRLSDKLHRQKHQWVLPLPIGLIIELVGIATGLFFLHLGLASASFGFLLIAAIILTTTFQPAIKLVTGTILGIRYSYFFFFYVEPRFKMRYGTYLSVNRWQRILYHLSGTIGSPLAFFLVAFLAREVSPQATVVCAILFLAVLGINLLTLVLGFTAIERLGPLGPINQTSAGGAVWEFRNQPVRRQPIRHEL